MQHNTKQRDRGNSNAKPRAIGLRLPNDEFRAIEVMAREQKRSLASMARFCMLLGLEKIKTQEQEG